MYKLCLFIISKVFSWESKTIFSVRGLSICFTVTLISNLIAKLMRPDMAARYPDIICMRWWLGEKRRIISGYWAAMSDRINFAIGLEIAFPYVSQGSYSIGGNNDANPLTVMTCYRLQPLRSGSEAFKVGEIPSVHWLSLAQLLGWLRG